MTARLALRTLAVLIAVAAVIDPVITREVIQPGALTVVAVGDQAQAEAMAVAADLGAGAATVITHAAGSAAAACPAAGACVLVSTGDSPEHATAGARLVGVLDARRPALEAGRTLRAIDAPDLVHRDSGAVLRVHLTRPAARIDVFDGHTLVGGVEPQDALVVDVPWVPIAGGARALRVDADGDEAHVGVEVAAEPVAVLIHEPEATWAGTFVRRALEDDPRFAVRGRARVAPSVTVTRGSAGALSPAALEEVGTVILTAPAALPAADVALLEQFVATRGGSLIVLNDQRPSGAALRLMPPILSERRDTTPQQAGALRASEWITFTSDAGAVALASSSHGPAVVSRPIGRGRVVVSGALDAWRYRDSPIGFDVFWTSVAWDAAALAGQPLRIEARPVVAQPGEVVRVDVEVQAVAPVRAPASDSVMATVDCGGARELLRLWPGARPRTFQGEFRAERAAECMVTVSTGGKLGHAPVTIRDELRRLAAEDGRLEALAAAHGATLARSSDELVRHLGEALHMERVNAPMHPMRSPYWLPLFALCLSVEWWLRRQAGLG